MIEAALTSLGIARQRSGGYPAAADALETALGISRDLRHRQGQADALCSLGIIQREAGDHSHVADSLKEALGIHLELGDQGGRAEDPSCAAAEGEGYVRRTAQPSPHRVARAAASGGSP